MDIDAKGLQRILKAAAAHKGASFVEIYQNCNIFNDGAFAHLSDRAVRDDHTLWLEHDKPLLFGKNQDKGIRLNGLQLEITELGNGITEANLLKYDATCADSTLAYLLSRLEYPAFPVPFGIFRNIEKPAYDSLFNARMDAVDNSHEKLERVLQGGQSWIVDTF
jgi:2-oxoglutarate ferredoxin oxidoreductase subunit beta